MITQAAQPLRVENGRVKRNREFIQSAHDRLIGDRLGLRQFSRATGVSKETVRRLKLGHTGRGYVFPLWPIHAPAGYQPEDYIFGLDVAEHSRNRGRALCVLALNNTDECVFAASVVECCLAHQLGFNAICAFTRYCREALAFIESNIDAGTAFVIARENRRILRDDLERLGWSVPDTPAMSLAEAVSIYSPEQCRQHILNPAGSQPVPLSDFRQLNMLGCLFRSEGFVKNPPKTRVYATETYLMCTDVNRGKAQCKACPLARRAMLSVERLPSDVDFVPMLGASTDGRIKKAAGVPGRCAVRVTDGPKRLYQVTRVTVQLSGRSTALSAYFVGDEPVECGSAYACRAYLSRQARVREPCLVVTRYEKLQSATPKTGRGDTEGPQAIRVSGGSVLDQSEAPEVQVGVKEVEAALAAILRRERRRHGIPITRIARVARTDRRTISKYEREGRLGRFSAFLSLCYECGVSPQELMREASLALREKGAACQM